MDGFFRGILEIIVDVKDYVYVLVAVALFCLAIGGLVGGDEVRAKIKVNLLWIALCAGLAIGAVQIAQWAVGNFTF